MYNCIRMSMLSKIQQLYPLIKKEISPLIFIPYQSVCVGGGGGGGVTMHKIDDNEKGHIPLLFYVPKTAVITKVILYHTTQVLIDLVNHGGTF